MNLNILFKDFPKICRLCLSTGNLQPILKTSVLDVLCTIANIKVKEEDKLPENACNNCIQRLEDIITFIDTCKNNDETLRSVVLKEYEKSLTREDKIKAYDGDDKYDDDKYDDKYDDDDEEEDDDEDVDIKDEDDCNSPDSKYYPHKIKQEFVVEPDITDINLNKDDGPVSCENCSENFPNRKSLHDHYIEIVNCRPIDFSPTSSNVPNILDYLRNNKKNEDDTKQKEEPEDEEPEYVNGRKLKGKRRFLCNYCGKNYTRKNGLDRHILSHTGIKPFECKECGKRYITKDTLKTHFLTHTGVKAHKCNICNKSFTQSSHLSYHMRRHSGEKPHSCTFCGKGFLSNYHLERHKLMHTGVKPFECHICGKHFVRGTTLRDHIFIHTGEKPFQCQHCGKQFNRKQSLTNHVLVHTGQVRSSSVGGGGGVGGGRGAGSGTELVTLGANMIFSEQNPIHAVYSDL